MHQAGGVCFADFAASAPYVPIDMHPADARGAARRGLFSPHKFLGGPGRQACWCSTATLYHNTRARSSGRRHGRVDQPLGPAPLHRRHRGARGRRHPGLPAGDQGRAGRPPEGGDGHRGHAAARGRHRAAAPWTRSQAIPRAASARAGGDTARRSLSFYLDGLHYNLVVAPAQRPLRRAGTRRCSCAGTYGHYLLHVDPPALARHHLPDRPRRPLGEAWWVRLSFHPTTPDAEIDTLIEAVDAIAREGERWAGDYVYSPSSNEFLHRHAHDAGTVRRWFDLAEA